MSELLQITPQPEFPVEDISDETAALLELLLQNRELIEASHYGAEMTTFLYEFGHRMLNLATRPQLDSTQQFAAFSHGIGAFEAMSALIRPVAGDNYPDRSTTTFHVVNTSNALNHALVDTLTDAKDKFRNEMPRTVQVIGESAARFYSNYTDYSLSGAAIARELEVQALAA